MLSWLARQVHHARLKAPFQLVSVSSDATFGVKVWLGGPVEGVGIHDGEAPGNTWVIFGKPVSMRRRASARPRWCGMLTVIGAAKALGCPEAQHGASAQADANWDAWDL